MPRYSESSKRSAPVVRMRREAFDRIKNSVGQLPAEEGGVLVADSDGVICDFQYDHSSTRDSSRCTPNSDGLSRLSPALRRLNRHIRGWCHSHPGGPRCPSGGDVTAANSFLRLNPQLDWLFIPIVMTIPDTGKFELLGFRAVPDARGIAIVETVEIEICEHGDNAAAASGNHGVGVGLPSSLYAPRDGTFDRLGDAVNRELLGFTRLIVVGAGGAGSFVEDAVRLGVGQVVLIDPDAIDVSNLSTQQAYRRDHGRPKVLALSERLRDINPRAVIKPICARLDDLSDEDVRRLAFGFTNTIKCQRLQLATGCGSLVVPCDVRPRPAVTVLCGCTDDFFPQARVNRLALKLQVPSLCAQHYTEAMASEITFTHPGFTPACHRCILAPRYRAYLEEGAGNSGTSRGSVISATGRLNALKLDLMLGLAHAGTAHPRWGNLISQMREHNLVQIRNSHDCELPTFPRSDEDADWRTWFGDAIWIRRRPMPGCPDCGARGDLLKAAELWRERDSRNVDWKGSSGK